MPKCTRLLVLALFAAPLPALGNGYTLMFVAGIPGESVVPNYADWIDLRGFSINIANRLCAGVTVSKSLDSASAGISAAAVSGRVFAAVAIDALKEVDAAFTSLSTGRTADQDVSEQVLISPASLRPYYRPQLPDGSFGTETVTDVLCPKK